MASRESNDNDNNIPKTTPMQQGRQKRRASSPSSIENDSASSRAFSTNDIINATTTGDEKPTYDTKPAAKDEQQLEANRQRARNIRKKKKQMIENMQQQIAQLTMDNQLLLQQTQTQQAEIQHLRLLTQQQETMQQFVRNPHSSTLEHWRNVFPI